VWLYSKTMVAIEKEQENIIVLVLQQTNKWDNELHKVEHLGSDEQITEHDSNMLNRISQKKRLDRPLPTVGIG